jgi:hypothetical protein
MWMTLDGAAGTIEDQVHEATRAPVDVVALGRSVSVWDVERRRTREIRIVSPEDADPRQGRISVQSPLAHALVGHRVGECVEARTPARTLRLRIEAIVPSRGAGAGSQDGPGMPEGGAGAAGRAAGPPRRRVP